MGLDVSLYKYKDFEKTQKIEKEYNDKSEKIWDKIGKKKGYDKMTKIEKDKAHKECIKLAKTLGLDEWGSAEDDVKKGIELNSKKYPKHLFKIGYFRSSYNSGGLNSILRDAIGEDLYSVFPEAGEDYAFQPNWEYARDTVVELMDNFKKFIKEVGACGVTAVTTDGLFRKKEEDKRPQSKNEAMEIYKEHLARHKKDRTVFDGYSSSEGEFSLKNPLKVKALIRGKYMGQEAVFAVYENDKDYKWYIESLEIVKETIDYVLSQPDWDKYYLHWSA